MYRKETLKSVSGMSDDDFKCELLCLTITLIIDEFSKGQFGQWGSPPDNVTTLLASHPIGKLATICNLISSHI